MPLVLYMARGFWPWRLYPYKSIQIAKDLARFEVNLSIDAEQHERGAVTVGCMIVAEIDSIRIWMEDEFIDDLTQFRGDREQ